MRTKIWSENLKERDHLRELSYCTCHSQGWIKSLRGPRPVFSGAPEHRRMWWVAGQLDALLFM
jgi:hypothetical protein